MERRKFLQFMGAVLSTVTVLREDLFAAIFSSENDTIERKCQRWLKYHLSNNSRYKLIANHYARNLESKAPLSSFYRKLFLEARRQGYDMESLGRREFGSVFGSMRRADFQEFKILMVDGWMLSESEVLAAVIAFRPLGCVGLVNDN